MMSNLQNSPICMWCSKIILMIWTIPYILNTITGIYFVFAFDTLLIVHILVSGSL